MTMLHLSIDEAEFESVHQHLIAARLHLEILKGACLSDRQAQVVGALAACIDAVADRLQPLEC